MGSKTNTKKQAAPRGTRDFHPADMAVRLHLESICRETARRHGFDEVDGPTFEHLELYTTKSGQGIVSELFSFTRSGGDTVYALRPELTPTVARMVGSLGRSAPKPVKWFSIGPMFRAERPQRGRLREHIQWNVDLFGIEEAWADAEIIAVAAAAFERMGLDPDVVRFRVSHRDLVAHVLAERCGVAEEHMTGALNLLDRRAKMEPAAFEEAAAATGLQAIDALDRFTAAATDFRAIAADGAGALPADAREGIDLDAAPGWAAIVEIAQRLERMELARWCIFDPSIVRGLAYYTGTVFEVHETSGAERAVAGGGRYDSLVELLGGPPTPAVGFAMGDVVIRLVLEDRGKLAPAEAYLPRPDAFVIGAPAEGRPDVETILARLRRAGLHARRSYRETTKVRKLLEEADRVRARCAVILGESDAPDAVEVKDLGGGTQQTVPLDELVDHVRDLADRG